MVSLIYLPLKLKHQMSMNQSADKGKISIVLEIGILPEMGYVRRVTS